MQLTLEQKNGLKKKLVSCLSYDKEIVRIVVFGSFVDSDDPNDMDIAVFQSSDENYLTLAMKYRRKTRPIADKIPLDIFPVRSGACDDPFLSRIMCGEIIYEKRNADMAEICR
ncbi:MAG: nucleotidyltransferase domain-containing protein [Deltaproteobacteria bacterium]|nr:MAG: nucleotidyltransferase domain-containing protein [Deltaproteobacteria bacterium]